MSKEYADTFQPITMRGLHLDSNSNNVLKKKREKKGTVNDVYETEFWILTR